MTFIMYGLNEHEQRTRQHQAEQAYSAVEQLPQNPSILLAGQVMASPVVTLTPEARISEALNQFQTNAFHHVPVVSSAGRLVGIVSDRNILLYLAGLTESYQQQVPVTKDGELKGIITRSDVLRAVMRHYILELWI